ncbi:MAG: fibronectin type III-like domain-contianing protein [Steroidobacteraceae bacterium]
MIIRKTVTVNIASRQLSCWHVDNDRWTVTKGKRAVMVRASSDAIRLKADAVMR